MRHSVIFDLYETLITENHPEWHACTASPAHALGINEQAFGDAWTRTYERRMTGHYRDYGATLRAICADLGAQRCVKSSQKSVDGSELLFYN